VSVTRISSTGYRWAALKDAMKAVMMAEMTAVRTAARMAARTAAWTVGYWDSASEPLKAVLMASAKGGCWALSMGPATAAR
jgi:hypothetical protein